MIKVDSPQERLDHWLSKFNAQHEVAATESPILVAYLTRFAQGEKPEKIEIVDARIADLFNKMVESYKAEALVYQEERRRAWWDKIDTDAKAGGRLYRKVLTSRGKPCRTLLEACLFGVPYTDDPSSRTR